MKSRDGKSQRREEKKKEDQKEKVSEGRSRGSKSRLAKAAGAEPCGQMRDGKLHAVVARSTFRSQNVQSTSASEHL